MNTHNDFLDNAVNDELEMECIGDLTTDVCSDMQNDTEKMCLSLQNATCGDYCVDTKENLVGPLILGALRSISCSLRRVKKSEISTSKTTLMFQW